MIYAVHNQDPGTPLDSQRPGLQRYQIGSVWVDVTDATGLAQAEAQYAEYQVAQANALKPKSVTMRQARLALLQANLLDSVNTAVAGMVGVQGDSARIEWNYSNEVKRNQPLTVALAQAIGMTEAEMDQLFVTAATL